MSNNQNNSNVSSTQFSLSIPSVEYILIQQVHQLQNENQDLRLKINTLLKSEDTLKEIIKCNEQTIEMLRKENEELKLRLKELEEKYNILVIDHELLKKDVAELKEENKELKEENKKLREENQILKKDVAELKEENKELREENKELREENKQLKKDIAELKIENIQLKEENQILKKDIAELKNDNYQLKLDVDILKRRDNPITVREGFVSLEKHIMLDITGSKKKARGFNDVKILFKDPSYSVQCTAYLKNHNITEDHINIISELKDKGNKSAHINRPDINRAEWDELAISMLDDPTDIDDIQLTKDLLKLLESYTGVGTDGTLIISKP